MTLKKRIERLESPAQTDCKFYYITFSNENENGSEPPANSWTYDGVTYNRLAGESDSEFTARIEAAAKPFAYLGSNGKLVVAFLCNDR